MKSCFFDKARPGDQPCFATVLFHPCRFLAPLCIFFLTLAGCKPPAAEAADPKRSPVPAEDGVAGVSVVPDPKPSLMLAENGVAKVSLAVNSKLASKEDLQAARTLAEYLGRVSGATFSVLEEETLPAGTRAVYVGPTEFAKSAGIDSKSLAANEGRLVAKDGNLVVVGGNSGGTSRLVFYFLEKYAGCRWYSVFDEVIPVRSTLEVPALDEHYRHAFDFANVYMQMGARGPYGDQADFHLRNRGRIPTIGVPPDSNTVHTYASYFDPADFPDNPEYASMDKTGKRITDHKWQFCQTNPDVRRIVLERFKEMLRKNPGKDYYELSMNDGGGGHRTCYCPDCQASMDREGVAGPYIDFVNFIADGIKDEFPEAMLSTLTYEATAIPAKTLKFRPNVTPRVCPIFPYSWDPLPLSAPENAHCMLWLKQMLDGSNQGAIWDYDGLALGQVYPAPFLESYADRLPIYKSLNVEWMFLESELNTNPRPFPELRQWVWFHLAEDLTRDPWELVQDFCKGVYGAGAEPIVEFLRIVEARKYDYPFRLYDVDFLNRGQSLMDTAEKAVANDPKALARVKEARLSLDLATLAYGPMAVTNHVHAGGKESDFTVDKNAVAARALEALPNVFKEKRWLVPASYAMHQSVVTTIAAWGAAAKAPVPLPEDLKGLPPGSVEELQFPTFANGYSLSDGRGFLKMTPPDTLPKADADSAVGVSLFLDPKWHSAKPLLPFQLGVYDDNTKKGAGGTVESNQIKGPGYHVYKIGRFPITSSSRLWFPASWKAGLRPLVNFANHKTGPVERDIYVSLKTSGPNFPHGNPNEPDGLWVDRVFLVDPAKQPYNP